MKQEDEMSLNLLFLHGLGCGGDTISMLNAEQPDIVSFFRGVGVKLLWHHTLSVKEGSKVTDLFRDILDGKIQLDILLLEGAVPAERNSHSLGGRSFTRWCMDLANVSEYTVAMGTCASFGGIPAVRGNTTGATGLQFEKEVSGGLLGSDYRSRAGLPVINLPGCPAHPDWVLETLHLIANGKLSETDLNDVNMPLHFYNSLAHHGCPRNEFYEFKSSAREYGQMGCLFEFLGCRGTQCESDCNNRLWLGRTGSCTRGGFPCIACTSKDFPHEGSRFFETELIGDVPKFLPRDVPKAWYIGITGLSKMATPERLKANAVSSHRIHTPKNRKGD